MKMESRSRTIDRLYRRRDRYEIPDWQRGDDVWDVDRQRLLIDTILRGWRLPKFYFVKSDSSDDYYEVVDGQQRLTAIWAFYANELTLDSDLATRVGGATYSELPDSVQDAFDDFEIQYDEISEASESDLTELFQRLQLGVGTTPDERLNATLGKLRTFCRHLSGHSFFSKVSVSSRRYAHLGICVRFAFLEIQGIPNQLRFEQLQQLLVDYPGFSTSSPVAKRMTAALQLLDSAFPEKTPLLRNRSVILAMLRLAARIVENENNFEPALLKAFLQSFLSDLRKEVDRGSAATDHDLLAFQRTLGGNLTSGTVIRTRERILRRKLLLYRPALAETLGVDELDDTGSFESEIRNAAERCETLIHQVNQAYSGSHGEDLFKQTNATLDGFLRLRTPISNVSEYGEFIDAVYVITYEATGAGSRYPSVPDLVNVIRDLRTDRRHDVDHGAPSRISKRRRQIASSFERISGFASPDVLPAASFPVVHSAILALLEAALMTVRNEIVGEA